MTDNGWMPMSSAPRDGTRVLVWMPYLKPECDIGYWCWLNRCWWFEDHEDPNDIQPTHWQHLPPPPEPTP